MAYDKQTWLDGPGNGTPISAARLNYMEDGIATAAIGDANSLAQNAAFTSRFAPKAVAHKAAQILARYNVATSAFTLYPGTATVVLSAADAASTIASAIRIPGQRLTSSYYDTDNDPAFSYSGLPAGRLSVIAGDVAQPDLLIGGSGQAARWQPQIGFVHTGQKVGIYFRALTTVSDYKLWVNGQPLTLDSVAAATVVSSRYHLEIDFGSVNTRTITVGMSREVSFGGVFIEPGASVRRTPLRPRIAVMGDSLSSGANGLTFAQRWLEQMVPFYEADGWQLGIGGTGYIAATSFIDRLGDVVLANPDVLIVWGGYNDQGSSAAALQAAVTTFVAAVKAALPSTIILLVGCWSTSEVVSATASAFDAAIKAAAVAGNVSFVSLIDRTQRLASVPAWAFSTGYVIGDRVTSGNNVWVCRVAHTSAGSGSINTSNFHPLSFITGTGRIGATTGRGNADLFIQSDGVHASQSAHKALGFFFAEALHTTLTAIVAAG